MPLFSVVVPVYNRAEMLRETLESVFAQDFTDYEVIVVDDGSTEDIAAVVREFGDRVKLLRQRNSGPGAARNLGIAHATGEYIAFLDSDDLWFPWTLATYASVIEDNEWPSFVAGKPLCFRERSALASAAKAAPTVNAFADYFASGDQWRWWGVSSFVVRTDQLRAVGGFTDENVNAEDADFAMRLGVASGFIQICAPTTFGYREQPVSAVADFDRTLAGVEYMVRCERRGTYPGGKIRRLERLRILTRHIRPVAVSATSRNPRAAWRLYIDSFWWHVILFRARYLVLLPFVAIAAATRFDSPPVCTVHAGERREGLRQVKG